MDREHDGLINWALTSDGAPSAELAEAASELTGHHLSTLSLVRMGTNLVFEDPRAEIILRVQRRPLEAAVSANLQQIEHLLQSDAPIVGPRRPASMCTPLAVITQWPRGRPAPPESQAMLGSVLRHLHGTPHAGAGLGHFDIRAKLLRRLKELDSGLPSSIASSLHTHGHTAVQLLEQLPALPETLIHGDAHVGNLVTIDDQPRMIDLDDICIGPSVLDLLPTFVAFRRFHRDATRWNAFKSAYGEADWELAESLGLVREVTMNTWLATLWTRSATARSELIHRIETWDGAGNERPWSAV